MNTDTRWTRPLQSLVVVCSAVFAVGTAQKGFMVIDEQTIRLMPGPVRRGRTPAHPRRRRSWTRPLPAAARHARGVPLHMGTAARAGVSRGELRELTVDISTARRLAKMRKLSAGSEKSAQVNDLIADLRETHRRRPLLQQEFDRAGLP